MMTWQRYFWFSTFLSNSNSNFFRNNVRLFGFVFPLSKTKKLIHTLFWQLSLCWYKCAKRNKFSRSHVNHIKKSHSFFVIFVLAQIIYCILNKLIVRQWTWKSRNKKMASLYNAGNWFWYDWQFVNATWKDSPCRNGEEKSPESSPTETLNNDYYVG